MTHLNCMPTTGLSRLQANYCCPAELSSSCASWLLTSPCSCSQTAFSEQTGQLAVWEDCLDKYLAEVSLFLQRQTWFTWFTVYGEAVAGEQSWLITVGSFVCCMPLHSTDPRSRRCAIPLLPFCRIITDACQGWRHQVRSDIRCLPMHAFQAFSIPASPVMLSAQ